MDNWAEAYRVNAEFMGYAVSEVEYRAQLTEAEIFQSYFEAGTFSATIIKAPVETEAV